jgi:hypothetical protein
MTATREPCAFCGDEHWTRAYYSAGRLVCSTCKKGENPAEAMPPTERQREQIRAWLRPRTNTPAAQLALRLGPATQPQGASRG